MRTLYGDAKRNLLAALLKVGQDTRTEAVREAERRCGLALDALLENARPLIDALLRARFAVFSPNRIEATDLLKRIGLGD